jgi:phage protein U
MFAELGLIRFQVLGSPENIAAEQRYGYAELQVVQARPRLQWLADELERLTLDLMFHAAFTDPTAQLTALRAAAQTHEAMPLVFGNGVLRGYFVIESIATRAAQLAADGTPVAVTVRMELKEYALDALIDPSAPPVPLFAPLALVTTSAAAGATAGAAAPAPLLPAGVSPLVSAPQASGALTPNLQPADVPSAVITRSAVL